MNKEVFYLVLDESKKVESWPFAEQLVLFKDPNQAVEFAKARGYCNQMGLNKTPGMKNIYQAGDTKVSIMVLVVRA